MADTTTTVTQTSIPDYAKATVERMIGKAEALSGSPYQPYTEDRIQQFTPLQLQSFEAAQNMQPSAYTGQAAGLADLAARGAMGTYYSPGQFSYLNVNAPNLGPTPQMTAAQTNWQPNLQQYQIDPRSVERVQSQEFIRPGTAEAYMSPYMQNVVDIQKREAARQDDIARQGRQARAVQAGAFGGSRQAIMESEAQRNLAQQMGDIQSRGSQAAFEQAQAQFNADQSRRMAAEQANQQALLGVDQQNLAAKLGVQQLGTQTGLQATLANLSNEQQAAVQNQAAQLQNQGLSAQQALQAALANQNAFQQTQQLGEQSRQYGAGLGLQGLQTALQGAGVMGGLGQQQFGQQMDIANLQNQYGTQQYERGQALLNQQYQDFLNQQRYPYQQLSYMSDMLRGLPMSQSTQSIYAPPPSMANTLGGLGMMAYGSGLFKAKGGAIPSYAKGGTVGAGLADLAISNMA